jgi:ABC-type thiamine transport system ATPase subunit
MRATLQAAAFGALLGADLELSPGRYVVLSHERESLRDLAALLAGREAPRSGRFTLDGVAPAATPATRRKIAALLAEESLPPGRSVQDCMTLALAARGETPSDHAVTLLADAGLAHLAGLSPRTLGQRELRSVALALALAHDSAELVVLHEPLATYVPAAFVLARLDAHTARGAIAVCTTTSPADATALGGTWLCAELGRVRATLGATPRLGAGPWQQVLIESRDARRLSQLLHDSAQGLATELGASSQSLKVTGPALDVTVQSIIALAREHGLDIQRIEAAVPPVEALLAARAGFARGAYEASRASALGMTTTPSDTPPGAA